MHNIYRVLTSLLLVVATVGCSMVEEEESALLEPNEVEHTLLMYLMADNNLAASIYQNALDAEIGMENASPATRLLIYLDTATKTTLYEIRYLPYGSGEEHIRMCKVLKEYPQQLSSTPQVMNQVMRDVLELAPSRSYGLVLSGHGTGWFPKPTSGTSYDEQKAPAAPGTFEYDFTPLFLSAETRCMGWDYLREGDNREIVEESYTDAREIIEGLAPIHFDYVIFDACFMASVEFLYEVRGIADYIIASPVEILAVGLPYREIVANLMTRAHDVTKIADIVMDVYMRDDKFSYNKSLALTTIDCSKLDALADVVADIYASVEGEGDFVDKVTAEVNLENVQVLDRMQPAAFYDLEDFVFELTDDQQLRERFARALAEVVVGAVHTEDIYSLGYTPDSVFGSYGYAYIENKVGGELDLSGLGIYIPYRQAPVTLSHYVETSWARRVYHLE